MISKIMSGELVSRGYGILSSGGKQVAKSIRGFAAVRLTHLQTLKTRRLTSTPHVDISALSAVGLWTKVFIFALVSSRDVCHIGEHRQMTSVRRTDVPCVRRSVECP